MRATRWVVIWLAKKDKVGSSAGGAKKKEMKDLKEESKVSPQIQLQLPLCTIPLFPPWRPQSRKEKRGDQISTFRASTLSEERASLSWVYKSELQIFVALLCHPLPSFSLLSSEKTIKAKLTDEKKQAPGEKLFPSPSSRGTNDHFIVSSTLRFALLISWSNLSLRASLTLMGVVVSEKR